MLSLKMLHKEEQSMLVNTLFTKWPFTTDRNTRQQRPLGHAS